MIHKLVSGNKQLFLDTPVLMGILNVTPDSFSDGGKYLDIEKAVNRAEDMINQGAKIIDIGGESSGPGSIDVSLAEELNRVIPVIKAIRAKNSNIWISVDTYKAQVARAGILAGADMINDVTALRAEEDDMLSVLREFNVPIVLMYSKDAGARTTRENKTYVDVLETVVSFLRERLKVLKQAGIKEQNIVVDPGMGAFISSIADYSHELMARLSELKVLDCPILVGPSRKSFLGGNIEDRLQASVQAALTCFKNGASIVRVHDVRETVAALTV